MEKINDGGPAFPLNEKDARGDHYNSNLGITIRDYFAAKAICGESPVNLYEHKKRAEWAYEMADAMLKAREAR